MIISARRPARARPDRMEMPSSSRGIEKMRRSGRAPGPSRKCPSTSLSVLLDRCSTNSGSIASMPSITAWLRCSRDAAISYRMPRPPSASMTWAAGWFVVLDMDRATDAGYLRDQYGTTHKLETRLEAHQRYSERPDDFFEWVLDRLDPRPGDLAVDVGCGTGSYHPLLVARGVRAVLGVDASAAMVAATQWQANAQHLPVVAIEATAEHLPLPTASYDLALANHVLFFVADQRAALQELRRVLGP